ERISAQIVDEGGFVLDLRLVDAELLGDDLLYSLFNVVGHASPPPWGPKVANRRFYQITIARLARRGARPSRASDHQHAAIHMERAASDVAGARTGEKCDGVRNVLRRAQAAQRD